MDAKDATRKGIEPRSVQKAISYQYQFTLAPAESVAEMEARLKAEAAAKAAADAEQAKKDKLAELQARRLTGNTGV